MPQNPQSTISQNVLNNYNRLRSVRTEDLRWVQITIDTEMNLKIESIVEEIHQKLLDFITIDVPKIEQQYISSQDIINLPMNPIINSFFNKQSMSWELFHCRLLEPLEIFMKEMCRNQNLNGLPKHCTKKLNKSPCTIC